MAAQLQLFGNNAESILDAQLLIAGTTITLPVGDGAKFPAIATPGFDFFYATLSDGPNETLWEIVKVTNRVGDVLTVVRAQDGTSALQWEATFTTIALRNTRATMQAMVNQNEPYTEHVETVSSVANVLTLDLALSNNFATVLTEDVTIVFDNVPASPELVPITLEATQDGVGGWTVTWPVTTTWPGGGVPVTSPGMGAQDVFGGYTRDGGASYVLGRSLEDIS